jgi:hypothetical protein
MEEKLDEAAKAALQTIVSSSKVLPDVRPCLHLRHAL